MNELRECPFCKSKVEMKNVVIRFPAFIKCKKCNYHIADYEDDDLIQRWNNRPIEDAWRKRAEKAESIIKGMLPMWIAAMSYCEHGRSADINRMRNYYNGRYNPLTSEEMRFLFSLIP